MKVTAMQIRRKLWALDDENNTAWFRYKKGEIPSRAFVAILVKNAPLKEELIKQIIPLTKAGQLPFWD